MAEIPTCGAELIKIGPGSEWCTLPYGHHGPHTNSTGVRWKGENPNGPIVTRPSKCASATCTNRVSEGQFVMVAITEQAVSLILCAPCAEALLKVMR